MVKNEQMMGIDIHPLERKSVAVLPFPDGDDRGFRPNGLEKVESHRTDTAPSSMAVVNTSVPSWMVV